MRTYARIQDGVVFEFFITDGNIREMFHPSLVWVDVTEMEPQLEVGSTFDGKVFIAPSTGD
ncbi:hypothetical protein WM21_01670 [Burkholderia ubonensis]|nr:hypothetical protein WM21_01670 [Burkholderia ubonensis]